MRSCVSSAGLILACLSLLPACASDDPPALGTFDTMGVDGGVSPGTATGSGGPTGSAGGAGAPLTPVASGTGGAPTSPDPAAAGGSGSAESADAGGLPFPFSLLPPPAPTSGSGADAGSCDNMVCFDVFDCALWHPGNLCGFTKCEGFVCKK